MPQEIADAVMTTVCTSDRDVTTLVMESVNRSAFSSDVDNVCKRQRMMKKGYADYGSHLRLTLLRFGH
ncbi:hypothetical protein RB195_009839 [Necator americanus]|uniref:Uncharacterized protein n=1 Tax=Necator americanus TaxID=51031 RepID=A0ABR1CV72_NECAM